MFTVDSAELAYFPLWSYTHPKAAELAERLAALAPDGLDRVFFTTGGGEAVESAWKLAKQYFKLTGKPAKHKVISRAVAYHGTPHGALPLTGLPGMKAPFEPLVPSAFRVPSTNVYRAPEHGDDPEAFGRWAAGRIEEAIEFEGPDTVAAVFLEPVSPRASFTHSGAKGTPMVRRVIACTVAGTAAALSLTACLGDDEPTAASAPPAVSSPAGAATTPAGAPTPTASEAPTPVPTESPADSSSGVPAGWHQVGGPENGVRMAVPESWVEIDLTSGELEQSLQKLGLQGANEELLRQSFAQLERQKAIYAIESGSAQTGYATNVNALCAQSPVTSVTAMENGARLALNQLGATNIGITRTTVAGRPGIRAAYTLQTAAGGLNGLQVYAGEGTRACSLTVTAKAGNMPAAADKIAGTLEIL